MQINKAQMKNMLVTMHHIRKFEEAVAGMFASGQAHGTTHLYIGEEAVATGVCAALDKHDLITSTHRGHGHSIAKGADLGRMMAEMMGRVDGYCGGKGGSMHIADMASGNLGGNGIVGGGTCIAVGAALALKKKRRRQIVACFFGDGATNTGAFHEAANLASVWRLPVLFVCENNRYGFSMPVERAMNVDDIAVRGASYGMDSRTVDGNDAPAVYAAAAEMRAAVLDGGPMLLECRTHRHAGHSKSDRQAYRSVQEMAQMEAEDPISRLCAQLLDIGLTQAELDEIDRRTTQDMQQAVAFAQASPYPSAEALCRGVYA